jgi:DNA-binding beta-propeller fold protein YncE
MVAMLRMRLFLLGGLVTFLSLGCGGGGASHAPGLSGTVTTDKYVIPVGTTQTVGADFKVIASSSIEIDGTLLVPPGVNVALICSGPLVIKGQISPTATSKAIIRTTRQDGGSTGLTLSGAPVTISGGVSSSLGSSTFISCNGAGTVTVSSLKTAKGADSTTPGVAGGNGGNIEIGTDNAIAISKQNGADNAQAPSAVVIGSLTTGDGGGGYNDLIGHDDVTVLTGTGTNGGDGGDITVTATTSVTVSGSVEAGNGGVGGGCTLIAAAQVTAGKKGENIVETTGDGGNGGSIAITPEIALTNLTAGSGATPGSAYSLPGNGGPDGGDGGDGTALIGEKGQDGTGGSHEELVENLSYVVQGGAGSPATDAQHNGGAGGMATLTDKKGGEALPPQQAVGVQPGSGGAGFSACSLKATAGTNGGKVGSAVVKGLIYIYKTAPTGGAGGSGNGPGTGGAAGTDDSGKTIGTAGKNGSPCSGGIATVSSTVSTPTTNPSFLSLDTTEQLLAAASADLSKTTLTLFNLASGKGSVVNTSMGISDVNSSVANGSTATRGNGLMYVSSSAGKVVCVINESTGAQTSSIAIPSADTGTYGIAFDPTSGRLYAGVQNSSFQNLVNVYDTLNSNALVGSITTDSAAYSMAVNPGASRLYVGDYSTKQLSVIDTSKLSQIRTINLPDYSGVVSLNPVTNTVYVSLYYSSSILALSQDLDQTLATIAVGSTPWGIGVDSTRNRIYVSNYNYSSSGPQAGTLSEIDGSTNKVLGTIPVGKSPTGVSVDEVADKIYVANGGDNTISILNGN